MPYGTASGVGQFDDMQSRHGECHCKITSNERCCFMELEKLGDCKEGGLGAEKYKGRMEEKILRPNGREV